LETALKKSNETVFQVKQQMIELQAENENLRIKEQEDRQKIQHLLALTQPVTEEVRRS
jgi:coiled-coil domain-containing protein 77